MAAPTPKAKQTLIALADELIVTGEKLSKVTHSQRTTYNDWTKLESRHTVTEYPAPAVDYFQWDTACDNFMRLLGEVGKRWESNFGVTGQNAHAVAVKVGTLRAIRDAINRDLLASAEDFIRAELFDDLLEQADYLLAQNYYLAAGVLGRAVLEEHLRKWCDRAGCVPSKPKGKPTVADYTQGLYSANALTKLDLKHVESMAAVGNDAAHNASTLKRDDVERLLRDVRDFLVRHPL